VSVKTGEVQADPGVDAVEKFRICSNIAIFSKTIGNIHLKSACQAEKAIPRREKEFFY
jgi:hypothetical protein